MTYAEPCADERIVEPWRPIHYLGSKLRAVSHLVERAIDLRRPGTAVCDLFSGSGTVANAFAQHFPTVAGDIQEYSRVICSALLFPPASASRRSAQLISSRGFQEELLSICDPLLDYEHMALSSLSKGDAEPIVRLQLAAPLELVEVGETDQKLARAFGEFRVRLHRSGLNTGSSTVVLRHFAGSYFSVRQAVDLCALLEASRASGDARDQQVAAALSTASELVNSVGKQFAQPLKLTDSSGRPKPHLFEKIRRDKGLSATSQYDAWLDRYQQQAIGTRGHTVVRGDYEDTIRSHCQDVSVIYADPPYGREHYSRYYHVLETMARGDDPPISSATSKQSAKWSTGAYRTDRHQSPFCIRSKAPSAFRSLFSHSKQVGASLILSYSPTAIGSKPRERVIDADDLISIAREYFNRVELEPMPVVEHNKLNRSRLNSDGNGSEILIVCR